MIKHYRVKIGYYYYRFKEKDAALDFAELAIESMEERQAVSIELIREEDEADE